MLFTILVASDTCADCTNLRYPTTASIARTPTMTTTIINSTRVNPDERPFPTDQCICSACAISFPTSGFRARWLLTREITALSRVSGCGAQRVKTTGNDNFRHLAD